jgi:tRNA threonylcarbamoyladenosine biosynthesis protein TsaB
VTASRPFPVVLAIDTAQEQCAVALRVAGRTAATRTLPEPKGHAEALLPLVAAVLAEAGMAYANLQLLAATTGPGVFTGVRVGLAAVRGLRLALGIPALGIGTLAATAATARARGAIGPIVVVNDARRGEVYVQSFDAGDVPAAEPALLSASDLPGHLSPGVTIVGTAAALVPTASAAPAFAAVERPDVGVVAAIAEVLHGAGHHPPPRPLYVRAPHITEPRKRA